MFTRVSYKILESGFWLLLITLFLISFPRSWSLWPLGIFLGTGLLLWIINFKTCIDLLVKNIKIIIPPVVYFLIHLISIIWQDGPLNMITDKLMFVLVPLLGLPIFISFSKQKIQNLFRSYILGIFIVSIILIIRTIFFVRSQVPPDQSFIEYSFSHDYWFLTSRFSVFEHPTYLSMKIIWIFLLVIYANIKLKISYTSIILLCIYFSLLIFLLASRAAIICWVVVGFILFFKMYRKKLIKPYVFPIAVLLIVIITGLSANKIARIYESADNLKIKLRDESIHWKDIDQRTREWFTAIQIIKEKPVTGAGYFLIKDKLLEKYLENGFFEEALQLMNAHNQYLEAQMTFGIAGSISLLMMLLIPLIYRKQIRYPRLMTIFIAMVSFFLMFESMFNRQWGIMFFLLFYCILCLGEEYVNI